MSLCPIAMALINKNDTESSSIPRGVILTGICLFSTKALEIVSISSLNAKKSDLYELITNSQSRLKFTEKHPGLSKKLLTYLEIQSLPVISANSAQQP